MRVPFPAAKTRAAFVLIFLSLITLPFQAAGGETVFFV